MMHSVDQNFYLTLNLLILFSGVFALRFTGAPDWFFRCVHILVGAYIIFLASPRFLVFYAVYWTTIAVLQRVVVLAREKQLGLQSLVFGAAVILALLPMVLWKLFPQLFVEQLTLATSRAVWAISPFLGTIDLANDILAPLGLSFSTFRAVDVLVKSYVGVLDAQPPDKVVAFGFFGPVLMAGPIAEYEEFENSKRAARPEPDDVLIGAARIGLGLIKIWGIAWILEPSQAIFKAQDSNNAAVFWFSLIVFTWYFYINFSGYADCAIGIARLGGVRLKENFANPYFQTSPQAFWASWHMSLTRFAQRNVFVPLGGYRQETQYLAIFGTMLAIALWHNLNGNMLLFALYHSAALIGQRYFEQRPSFQFLPSLQPRIRNVIMGLATYLFVVLSFPLLMLPTMQAAGVFYLNLLGIR